MAAGIPAGVLRVPPAARAWTEPHLHAANLVYPVFVTGEAVDVEIKGFEPNKQWGAGKGQFEGLAGHLKALQVSLRGLLFRDAQWRFLDRLPPDC